MSLSLQPSSLLNPAYSGVQASLQYLFAQTGSLLPSRGTALITFTRASSGTYFDSTGTLQTALTDAARFDYNPATLIARGLLIEEARTNSCLQSETLDNASWGKTDITVTADAGVAPTGASTADLVTEGSVGTASMAQTITISAGTTQSQSWFVKRSGAGAPQWVKIAYTSAGGITRAWFDILNGVAGTVEGSAGTHTVVGSKIRSINNSWYRISLTVTIATDTAASVVIQSANADNSNTRLSNATYLAWGMQNEVGAFVTSYIGPTTTAAVTRAADIASITGANFTSFWNATQGTIVVGFMNEAAVTAATFPTVVRASDGTSNNFITVNQISTNNRTYAAGTTGGVAQWDINSSSGTYNTTALTAYKAALAYQANNIGYSLAGTAAGTDTVATIPSVDRLEIGSANGSGFINGWISSLSYYNIRQPDPVLPVLST